MPQATVMRDLFDRVAWRYDLANRVLSAGSDMRWRRAVADEAMRDNPQRILDACSGTADQAILIKELMGFCGMVVCADISFQMLRLGKQKLEREHCPGIAVASDAHRIALRDESFDCVTIDFGVRNFDNIVKGLREIARVLRPQGKIVILEFTRPVQPLMRGMYRQYLTKVLPWVGGFLTGQRAAYRYLASSIEQFLSPEELTERLEAAGFTDVRHRFLSAGIVAITTARKAGQRFSASSPSASVGDPI